ncbi:MAG: hypothetical protein F7B61_06415 [Caldisphaeraceae archaeon]|nr:hypothetical protein [Caldisphaeraceae archaeon]
MKFFGDPKKVADRIATEKLTESKKIVDEAYDAAKKLLQESYRASLIELRKGISEKFQELGDALKSYESMLALEAKKGILEKRNSIIDQVIADAIEVIKKEKKEDWYRLFIKNLVDMLSLDAQSYGVLVVYASEEDRDLVKDIVSGYESIELADEPIEILGGLVATNKDGSVKLDYTIDQIIKENEVYLRGVASESLFGGRYI